MGIYIITLESAHNNHMLRMYTYSSSFQTMPSHSFHKVHSRRKLNMYKYHLQLSTELEKSNSFKGQRHQQPETIKISEMQIKQFISIFQLLLRLSNIFLLCIQIYMPVKFCCQNDSKLWVFLTEESKLQWVYKQLLS